MNRRSFIALGATLAAPLPGMAAPLPGMAAPKTRMATRNTGMAAPITETAPPKIKTILFDGFPIFDPRSVFHLANKLIPEKGSNLVKEWRARQFEYTWLRSMTHTYADFFNVTKEALAYAASAVKQDLSSVQQAQLMEAWYHLSTWPEVPQALKKLKDAGYRLGMLSNFTAEMLQKNTSNNQIDACFDHLISVDKVQTYKPDPRTYALGMSQFHLTKEEILFVPYAGWDAAGAKTYGYQTFWVNGLQLPVEQLGVVPDGVGTNLNDLLNYLHIS